MNEERIRTINGTWDSEAEEWTSEDIMLTGDSWLEITLPDKGRVVIKKAEKPEGPFPKALISKWRGPEFKIKLYGTTEKRYIRVCTTDIPTSITIVAIKQKKDNVGE